MQSCTPRNSTKPRFYAQSLAITNAPTMLVRETHYTLWYRGTIYMYDMNIIPINSSTQVVGDIQWCPSLLLHTRSAVFMANGFPINTQSTVPFASANASREGWSAQIHGSVARTRCTGLLQGSVWRLWMGEWFVNVVASYNEWYSRCLDGTNVYII